MRQEQSPNLLPVTTNGAAAFAPSRPYPAYSPADCPFETVIIDVTHRCNMGCHNCYIPNRTIPDLDAGWLKKIFAQLPRGTFVRLVGAEPTMRQDLPELISSIHSFGHHPVMLTNGLKLTNREYLQELRRAGLRIAYLSLNGAFDDDLYEAIDGMRCAARKRQAFDNLRAERVFTSLGMIVVRGVNEHAVADLWQAALGARNVREFHLRSIGSIGRFMQTNPLSLDELQQAFSRATGIAPDAFTRHERTASSYDFTCGRIRIQLTQWPDLGSTTRGRLTPEGQIVPFFEHVLENEGGY